jgi:hypothetical protein
MTDFDLERTSTSGSGHAIRLRSRSFKHGFSHAEMRPANPHSSTSSTVSATETFIDQDQGMPSNDVG